MSITATRTSATGGVPRRCPNLPGAGDRHLLRGGFSMKRVASSILILGWIGCSQQSVPPPAQIQGTNGLALFGNLLFITSTETNEIKILTVGSVTRDFVRAPNPLEPLSIPVLDRPIDLARDLNYDSRDRKSVV